jgi:NAD-dependent dihydropyrimidine dehydrogenase PreA subunit
MARVEERLAACWSSTPHVVARLRQAENAEGNFFVDSSCIDCAVCRNVAPSTFARSERAGASVVAQQPLEAAALLRGRWRSSRAR